MSFLLILDNPYGETVNEMENRFFKDTFTLKNL